MRKSLVLSLLLSCLILLALAINVSAVDISDCATLDQENTYYYMTEDIINSDVLECINITASGITLDCQGHTIDGVDASNSVAIDFTGSYANHITIKNCQMTDWEFYIWYENAINGTIINNNFSSSKFHGDQILALYNVDNSTVINNTFQNNQNYHSIYVYSGAYNNISNNIIKSNLRADTQGAGIQLDSGSLYNYIYNNTITNNNVGIDILANSGGNKIYNNIIENNTQRGIAISTTSTIPNLIYNNLFNNSLNYLNATVKTNYWNTSLQNGSRIYSDGTQIGGNYWANATGGGYSEICTDANADGFCDSQYSLAGNNIDYLPLSDGYNETPQIRSSRILPTIAYTNDTLQGYCNATDVNEDNLTYYYIWYLEKILNTSGSTTDNYIEGIERNIANVSSGNLMAGQNWTLSCRAFDGTSNSSWKNSTTLTISSAKLTSISYTPSIAYTNTDIVFNTTYTDGASGTVYCEIYNNSVHSWTDTFTNIANGTVVNCTILSANFSKGDTISVNITANDGIENSTLVSSANSNNSEFITNSTCYCIKSSNPFDK